MRRSEGRARQHTSPVRGKPDEIVAVGAIAMAEHDKMGGRLARRLEARTVEGHDATFRG
jgi:hypothetical protein